MNSKKLKLENYHTKYEFILRPLEINNFYYKMNYFETKTKPNCAFICFQRFDFIECETINF